MPTELSTDLTMLVWAVALCLVQMVVSVLLAVPQVGLPALSGNREGLGPFAGMCGRAMRAHHNMLESLVLFAALVLVAAVAGRANDMTALGAQIFFWARVAYAVIYVIGIAWVRTAIWTVSIVGLVMIFLQLI